MKFSTILAVLTVAVALATTGCRYDKARGGRHAGDAAGDEAVQSETSEIDTSVTEDVADAQEGYVSDLLANGKGFDELYQRCNDVNFAPVYFGFDASALPAGEMAKIEAVAAHLQEKPGRVVIIEGNCDERGSNEYNLSLGDLRATSIRAYLESIGIAPNRIQTKSYGEEKPAVVGHDESAWAKNRRGEFAVFQHK